MRPGGTNEPEKEPWLFPAQCRSRSSRIDVHVIDITVAGCMIFSASWKFMPGEHLLIQLPGLQNLGATVLWSEDGEAAFQFDKQLYEPVLAHLLQRRSN